MRIIVFFDLPVTTKANRRKATRFRNFLLDDGFDMLQYSVYARVCANHAVYIKHLQRVKKESPKDGSVRVLAITENQFTSMHVVVGEKTAVERKVPAGQLTIF